MNISYKMIIYKPEYNPKSEVPNNKDLAPLLGSKTKLTKMMVMVLIVVILIY